MLIHNPKYTSRYLLIFLLVVCNGLTFAASQDEGRDYNVLSFRQIDLSFPWLSTGNAAAISQLENLFPAELKIGARGANGDFHSVFSGESFQSYGIYSRSFNRIGRITLHGSLDYSRSIEKNSGYANNNDPNLNYPYLLADTLVSGNWDREFFTMEGGLSIPLSKSLTGGVDLSYSVGEASQNRDPRPDNKIVKLKVAPGLFYKIGKLSLGANLLFGYYNEDIDITIVKDRSLVSMFQMYGLGTYNYYLSGSYYRLYQKQTTGAGLQFSATAGRLTNLFYGTFDYASQTVDDGRIGSTATWSAVKNDARLDGTDWMLTDVVSFSGQNHTHQLTASFQMKSNRGTEFIQRLENVNETDLERWITYAKEQKYYSLQSATQLKYAFFATDESGDMKSLFSSGIKRSVFSEEYHLPDQSQRYSNIQVQTSYLRLLRTPKNTFTVEFSFEYQFNTEKEQQLPVGNFIVERIYKPELKYLTQSYFSPGVSVAWQAPLKHCLSGFFVKTDFNWSCTRAAE